MSDKTYYDVLGVPRDASAELIKKIYKQLLLIYHPDHFPDKELAQKKTIEIDEARRVLLDPIKRSVYDQSLAPPNPSLSPTTLNFGTLSKNAKRTLKLTVCNNGGKAHSATVNLSDDGSWFALNIIKIEPAAEGFCPIEIEVNADASLLEDGSYREWIEIDLDGVTTRANLEVLVRTPVSTAEATRPIRPTPSAVPTPTKAPSPSPQQKGFAVAALTLGIISILCAGILTAPFAIGYGIAALVRIKRNAARYGGKRMAVGGLVTGTLGLVISGSTFIAFLSNLNSGQNQTKPTATDQRRSSEPTAPQSRPNLPASAETAPATIIGHLRANAYAQGGSPGIFEVRILDGQVSNNRIIVQVRETSVNYDGSWSLWSAVIGQTYLRDNLGNTFRCDAGQSSGSSGGFVRSGGYREGTLIFPGTIPPNISRITLRFAYFPGHEPIEVSTPIISESNPEGTAQAQQERPLLEPSPYRTEAQPTQGADEGRNEASLHVSRAQAFFEQRQYKAAIDECNQALRLDPKNREALRLRAQIKKTMAILEANN